MSAELRPLLRAVREAQPFGPIGFGMMTPGHHEQVFNQIQDARTGFEVDMKGRLQDGFSDMPEEVRDSIRDGSSLLSLAYSAGLSNDELKKAPVAKMAALTALTSVANRLIDLRDPLMRGATLRWCGSHPNPESAMPKEEASRLTFLRGINQIIRTTIPRKDRGTTLSVMHTLMAANVGAHDLTMQWKDAGEEHEAAFWDEHTDEVAHNLLVTGALPSATIPLIGMYHRYPGVPSVREVWSSSLVQKQCKAANAIIRVDDDFGDRRRDADPKNTSINLFNLASSVHGKRLIGAFCVKAGIKDNPTIDRITAGFHAVSSDNDVEAVRMVTDEFEQNFWDANNDVPKALSRHTTLVIRALAAGRANAIGDDAL